MLCFKNTIHSKKANYYAIHLKQVISLRSHPLLCNYVDSLDVSSALKSNLGLKKRCRIIRFRIFSFLVGKLLYFIIIIRALNSFLNHVKRKEPAPSKKEKGKTQLHLLSCNCKLQLKVSVHLGCPCKLAYYYFFLLFVGFIRVIYLFYLSFIFYVQYF